MSRFAGGVGARFDVRGFFMSEDRNTLYKGIDTRSLQMVNCGLFEEVTKLMLSDILTPYTVASRAIGYRQALEYLTRENFSPGDLPAFMQFLEKFSAATRHLARKQFGYFRTDPSFLWLQRDKPISSPGHDESCSRMVEEILHWTEADRPAFQQLIDQQISTSSRVRKWSERNLFAARQPWSALQLDIRASQNGNPVLRRYTFGEKGSGSMVAVADVCVTKLRSQIFESLPLYRAASAQE